LLASALGSGAGVAVLMAYSVGSFIGPLAAEFGWSRAAIAAAPTFYAIVTVFVGPLVGALADRHGARPVALVSQLLLAAAFTALSQLRAPIGWLYAGYALLAALGAGTLPIIWSRAITGWFVHSRGLALGFSLIGTGLIGAALPSLVNALVERFGWRGAFLGLAAMPLLVGMPLAVWFFREPPEDLQRRASRGSGVADAVTADSFSFGEAVRSFGFWQMSLAFMVVAIAVSAVLSHTQSLLVDRGISAATAAALLGLFGLAISLGRLVSGYLLDVFRGPWVACGMFAMPALACVLLLTSGTSLWLSGAAIVLVGLAGGAEHDIAAFFTARYFGRMHFSAIYGLLYALYGLGGGFGPLLAGAVFDATGSYDQALVGGMFVFVIAAALIGSLRTPARRLTHR
jgi:MFS family permease